MKKQLEILIVEDREENRRAAQEYFDTRDDTRVDFATSYDEGLQKLQEGLYGIGIFDLELPKSEGAEPEKLGFELAREATKYAMPWAVITAGIDHHKCKAAFVSYSREGIKDPNKKLTEITEIPKTDSRSWQTVYETLVKNAPNIAETVASRERYKRFVGKPYQLDPQIAESLVPGFKEK